MVLSGCFTFSPVQWAPFQPVQLNNPVAYKQTQEKKKVSD